MRGKSDHQAHRREREDLRCFHVVLFQCGSAEASVFFGDGRQPPRTSALSPSESAAPRSWSVWEKPPQKNAAVHLAWCLFLEPADHHSARTVVVPEWIWRAGASQREEFVPGKQEKMPVKCFGEGGIVAEGVLLNVVNRD